ncbi:MAG: hypothetical protein CR984_07265 [Proteobacteria bacterium]|nr:MAG: hypothetical protein CR984_07265 [Pseudomonadota bacterium]
MIDGKACLSVHNGCEEDGTREVPSTAAVPGELYERLEHVEKALKKLQRKHARLRQEVQRELIAKYREILIAERERCERLLDRYNLLETQGGGLGKEKW